MRRADIARNHSMEVAPCDSGRWSSTRFPPTLLVYPVLPRSQVRYGNRRVPLCTAVQYQTAPASSRWFRGAIVAWVDYRDNDYNIYAQRIDASALSVDQ